MAIQTEIIQDLMAQSAERSGLQQRLQIEVVAETGSTNLDLMQIVRNRYPARPIALIAEKQTAGRGRSGRQWLSEPGGALTFSLAWHFPLQARATMGLPLVVGVAIANCLRQIGVSVNLKWPNDILKEGKKLAGILVESQNDGQGGVWAVVGVGLNLSIPESIEHAIGHQVADAPWLAQMERNALLAQLLQAMLMAMEEFQALGFPAFVERWNHLHAYAQQMVKIIDQGKLLHQGIALGVDEQGSLLLRTESETLRIHSGDVSLRALP